ncbi:uncharacterized protein LOC125891257 [Epinephelus fuscoguttatus]|uniref:uncharacterized protein LOC125891257 n=1 Tax=Epinephelus fuscoguttatus TaxID=293821 RepID=UPI0020D09AC6|nr:uncharacterized protein LOC125891257 [Epinephelus fuscoguttatus]
MATGRWRQGYPPSPSRKCPAGGYRACLYIGHLWRTSASCTDPGLPMGNYLNVVPIDGTSSTAECLMASKVLKPSPHHLHLFTFGELNHPMDWGDHFLHNIVGNSAHSGEWHSKYVCSHPVRGTTGKPVNGHQHLHLMAPSMGLLPGQHLHQHVDALPGEPEGWLQVSPREKCCKDGHILLEFCIVLRGTLVLFLFLKVEKSE